MANFTLKIYSVAGVFIGEIVRWSDLSFQKVLSGIGSGSVAVLVEDAERLSLYDRPLIWKIGWADLATPPFAFITEAVSKDKITQGQSVRSVFSGRGVAGMLEWATVLPAGYPSWTLRDQEFAVQSPMAMWHTLFNQAKARGALAPMAATFTGSVDSAAMAWGVLVTLGVSPGGDLLSLLDRMATIALCDWVVDSSLNVVAKQTYGANKWSSVKFRVGVDQVAYSENRESRDLRNAGYFEGEGGISEAIDAGSVATWGRREAYIEAGDASNTATTTILAQRFIDAARYEKIQRLVKVAPTGVSKTVFVDYDVGDWVDLQESLTASGGETHYRTIAIAVTTKDGTNVDVELGLQSLLEDRLQRLAEVGASGGGSSVTGPGSQNPLPPVIPTIPAAPTGLSLTTGADINGSWIDATWISVAPKDPDPVVEYEVAYGPTGAGTIGVMRSATAPVRIRPVTPGVNYTATVRSISRSGVSSALSGTATVTAGADSTLPAQTSGLSVAAGIRTLTAVWTENIEVDVKNGAGAYDIQIATDAGFTVGLRGQRISGTITSFADLVTGTTYYARVRAVDSSGNVSAAWSTTASATTGAVGGDDIGVGAVDTINIANLAVTNAQIGGLAVDSAKIADAAITTVKIDDAQVTSAKILTLDVGKLTTGTLTATTITIGAMGVLRAGLVASPFNYLLLDQNGLRFFKNASDAFTGGSLSLEANVATGNISITGVINATSATLTGDLIMSSLGKIKTGASGKRIEISTRDMSISGLVNTILFYSGDALEDLAALGVPGYIAADVSSSGLAMTMSTGQRTTGERAYITMWTGNGSGSNITLNTEEIALGAVTIDNNTGQVDVAGALHGPFGNGSSFGEVLAGSILYNDGGGGNPNNIIQAGTMVVNFSAGNGNFDWPVAFPRGIISVVVSEGGGLGNAVIGTTNYGVVGCGVYALWGGGAGITGNVRFNYIAVGW